jgi:hypothetical protein
MTTEHENRTPSDMPVAQVPTATERDESTPAQRVGDDGGTGIGTKMKASPICGLKTMVAAGDWIGVEGIPSLSAGGNDVDEVGGDERRLDLGVMQGSAAHMRGWRRRTIGG